MTVAEVAHRLGVKRETVYAYVSRGLLERHPSSGAHASVFDPDAVERLAGRARRNDGSGALEVVVETQLTRLDPAGRLYFRGHDAIELARFRSFEQVAALLWGGEPVEWALDDESLTLVRTLVGALPATTAAVDRIPLVIAGLGATDPRRGDRTPDGVRRTAGRILAAALEAVAPHTDGTAGVRMWNGLSGGRVGRPVQVAAIDAALVLLADHELAASTLAARVAASAWADPYRVVLAGLGPIGGTLHGAASLAVEGLLARIEEPARAFETLEQQLATLGGAPGFGHRVYRDRDPRADHVLGRIAGAAVDGHRARVVQSLNDAAVALQLPAPNVDFAVAGLAYAMDLQPGAASTIFTVARLAGLIAHAIEEYPHRLRFRPRARYVGP